MAAQHRHLRPIHAELAEALAQQVAVRTAQAHFARYREALDAHFTLEGEMFFPALHGLRPDWGEALARLDREHVELRASLAHVGRRIAAGAPADAGKVLERFTAELRQHEMQEEQLIARLDG